MLGPPWLVCEGEYTHNDAGSPRVEQQEGAHQESASQHNADGLEEPVAQANVLFPKEKRVATGVTEHAMHLGSLVTDASHTLNGCHEVGGLPQSIEVEGELCKLQGLCSWNCQKERQPSDPVTSCPHSHLQGILIILVVIIYICIVQSVFLMLHR